MLHSYSDELLVDKNQPEASIAIVIINRYALVDPLKYPQHERCFQMMRLHKSLASITVVHSMTASQKV